MASKSRLTIIPWLVSMAILPIGGEARADTREVIFACSAGGMATLFDTSVSPQLESDAVKQSVAWRDTVSLKIDEDGRYFSVQPLRPIRLLCGSGDNAIQFVVTAAWDTDLKEVPIEGVPMWPSVSVERHGQALLKDVALTMCDSPPPADRRNCAVRISAFIGSAGAPRIALHRLTLDWVQ